MDGVDDAERSRKSVQASVSGNKQKSLQGRGLERWVRFQILGGAKKWSRNPGG